MKLRNYTTHRMHLRRLIPLLIDEMICMVLELVQSAHVAVTIQLMNVRRILDMTCPMQG